MAYELRLAGLKVEQQRPVEVRCDGVVMGTYLADLLVENSLIVELKLVKTLEGIHSAQCLNYLKASGHWLCLLLNFGNPRLQIKRLVNG